MTRAIKRAAGAEAKVCPECGHVFQDNGWDGIDAHWKAKHQKVMPFEEAWPLLQAGTYKTDATDRRAADTARYEALARKWSLAAVVLLAGVGIAHAETGKALVTTPFEDIKKPIANFEYCGPSSNFPPNDCNRGWICREPGTSQDRPYICVHNWTDAEKRCDLDHGKRDYMCTETVDR